MEAGAAAETCTSATWARQHQCAPHLPSLFYLPDYVGEADEERLLREVRASRAKWVQLSGRRLQNHGGVVHAKGLIPAPLPSWLQPLLQRLAVEGGGGGALGLYGDLPPNHVLVNSYLPGEGIMPHEDGPAYHPVVAILSLGAPAVLRFRRKQAQTEAGPGAEAEGESGCAASCVGGAAPAPSPPPALAASLLLAPRSLVVFRDEAFTDCLHSIDEVHEEVLDGSVANLAACGVAEGAVLPRGGERISLTVRRVARVLPSILRPRGT